MSIIPLLKHLLCNVIVNFFQRPEHRLLKVAFEDWHIIEVQDGINFKSAKILKSV